jgi:hypothetical protein
LGQITIDLRSSVVVAIMNIIDLTPQQPRRAIKEKLDPLNRELLSLFMAQ